MASEHVRAPQAPRESDCPSSTPTVAPSRRSAAYDSGPGTAPDPEGGGHSIRSRLRDYAESLIIAVVLALVIRTFVVQAFEIPSGSMLPTLQIGDHIVVAKFLYWLRPIQRRDIIVFKYPQDESRDFIKRVIGLPGETVEMQGDHVYIDGKPLPEPYAAYSEPRPLYHFGPVHVPPGSLFMMGDNRDNSLDSRSWGFLDEHKVEGKAFLIYFSFRSQDIPSGESLPSFLYVLAHPSLIRWGRLGEIVN